MNSFMQYYKTSHSEQQATTYFSIESENFSLVTVAHLHEQKHE